MGSQRVKKTPLSDFHFPSKNLKSQGKILKTHSTNTYQICAVLSWVLDKRECCQSLWGVAPLEAGCGRRVSGRGAGVGPALLSLGSPGVHTQPCLGQRSAWSHPPENQGAGKRHSPSPSNGFHLKKRGAGATNGSPLPSSTVFFFWESFLQVLSSLTLNRFLAQEDWLNVTNLKEGNCTHMHGLWKHYVKTINTAAAKSLQLCLTLCNPIDSSPPGSPIPGILQARTLEWVAISFSNAWKWKAKVKSLSHVQLLATPWAAAYQAPPSTGFSRQEYWSGCHCLLHHTH